MILRPDASVAALVDRLRRQGSTLKVSQVQSLFDHYHLDNKRGSLELARLVADVQQGEQDQLRNAALLPGGAIYTFDRAAQGLLPGQRPPVLIKTRKRRVVSLRFGELTCCEVLRQDQQGKMIPSGLEQLVGSKKRYAYDLIVHVGLEYFQHGRSLEDIGRQLTKRSPGLTISTSTLYQLCGYFTELLGLLHQHRALALRQLCQGQGLSVWLLDCTQEGGSWAFFGVLETRYGILLGCWKVPTENQKDLEPCLREAVQRFGKPGRVLHDLSPTMSAICQAVLSGVPQGVCHFHFARDVGRDLCESAQRRLSQRQAQLGVLAKLHEQRKEQVGNLRHQTPKKEDGASLAELLQSGSCAKDWTTRLGREVLLGVHYWVLDYARDGHRQGHPFDPLTLYLHRRLVKASEVLETLVSQEALGRGMPRCLWNLCQNLRAYRKDEEIQKAAQSYEAAQELFGQLRGALRLSTSSGEKTPMSEEYELSGEEQKVVVEDLKRLAEAWKKTREESEDEEEKERYKQVLEHVERYEGKLACVNGQELNKETDRTTNQLERTWRGVKRRRRKRHGRSKLTRDMEAMSPEEMLAGNLEIEEYRRVVGTPEELPALFAEVGQHVNWGRKKPPPSDKKAGPLPRRCLRQNDFLDRLLRLCPRAE